MTIYNETAGVGANTFNISFLGATRVIFRNQSTVPLIFRWDGLDAGPTAAPEGRSIVVRAGDLVAYQTNSGARVPDGGSLSVFSPIGAAQFSVEVD